MRVNIFNPAVRALNDWIATGTAPAHSPRLELTDDGSDCLFDDLGNTVGGIRTPLSNSIGRR